MIWSCNLIKNLKRFVKNSKSKICLFFNDVITKNLAKMVILRFFTIFLHLRWFPPEILISKLTLKDSLLVDFYCWWIFWSLGNFPAHHKRFLTAYSLEEIWQGPPLMLAVSNQSDFEDFSWLLIWSIFESCQKSKIFCKLSPFFTQIVKKIPKRWSSTNFSRYSALNRAWTVQIFDL